MKNSSGTSKSLKDEPRPGTDCGQAQSRADLLISIAEKAELFHSPDGEAFATITYNDHKETLAVRGRRFQQWLRHRYFKETSRAPNSESVSTALSAIEATANFRGEEYPVFVRVGQADGTYYVDLCDDQWRVIAINADGWHVVEEAPIRFRRAPGMRPLPVPNSVGSVFKLEDLINCASSDDFVLLVMWLMAALRPRGPYPVLVLVGEQGTAKSTLAKILRQLVDPNVAPLRTLPRTAQDLFVSANNGHILAFDNISELPSAVSDLLCRISTGAGFSTRRLYTDSEEIIVEATKPIILNGIEDFLSRPDLADRAIFIRLDPIPEEKRRTDEEVAAVIDQLAPKVLGALLDGMVHGLRRLPSTKLECKPRMADFALWGAAAETAFFNAGQFRAAYQINRYHVDKTLLETDPFATAVRAFMKDRNVWRGTATTLLKELNETFEDSKKIHKLLPTTPQHLSGKITRLSPMLRRMAIDVQQTREGRAGERILIITNRKMDEESSSASSAPSPNNGLDDSMPCMNSRANDFADIADGADDEAREPGSGLTANGSYPNN